MKTFIQMLWAFVAIGSVLAIVVLVLSLLKSENNLAGYLAAICFVLIPYGLVKGFEGMLKDD